MNALALFGSLAHAASRPALLVPRAADPGVFPSGSQLLDSSWAGSPVPMMALLGAMALLPFAVLMLTSFSKIAVVLSIARSALGSQQVPPTTVLTGLALVLSLHVMAPVLSDSWREGKQAFSAAHSADEMVQAAAKASLPWRAFLSRHAHESDRALFFDLARRLRGDERAAEIAPEDLAVTLPAFVISELKEAFQVGFLVFLPFLVLDMVIANLLLALGMQSLSPSSVSLPFKLLLFVAVDGWRLLAEGLVLSYR
jgi:type III secretion protein R